MDALACEIIVLRCILLGFKGILLNWYNINDDNRQATERRTIHCALQVKSTFTGKVLLVKDRGFDLSAHSLENTGLD